MFKWSEKFGPNLVWEKFWTVAYINKLISIFSNGQKKRNQFQKFSDCAVQFFKPVFVKLLAYFLYIKLTLNRSMVAQMTERATGDIKVPGLIPSWIQWDFASKYMFFIYLLNFFANASYIIYQLSKLNAVT